MPTLHVESTRECMWRVNASGGELGHVTCYHVVDEGGRRIAGGHHSGNNTQSGHPVFARKMDALAFAAGYSDLLSGMDKLTYTDKAGVVWASKEAGDRYCVNSATPHRNRLASCYVSGVDQAIDDHKSAKTTPSTENTPHP